MPKDNNEEECRTHLSSDFVKLPAVNERTVESISPSLIDDDVYALPDDLSSVYTSPSPSPVPLGLSPHTHMGGMFFEVFKLAKNEIHVF